MALDNNELPFVSALLVTRNEQDYIEQAMLSLINQTYPKSKYEIVVIDGESTDKTLQIVNSLIEQYRTFDFDIRIISNPKRILAAGWNLGIKNAKGDYVVRIDAHAVASQNFIEKSVETMMAAQDAVCVGGKLTTKSLGGDENVVSLVLSSPFGVGNSSFRVSDTAGYADTAVYGLYKKEIFNQVGFFNEQYVRNQDIELHSRITVAGGKFYFNPEISSVYYSRTTVKKMVKQAFGNGKWNMVLLKNQNSALSLRHLVPFAFVLFLAASTSLGFFNKFIWLVEIAVLLLHFTIGFFAGCKKTKRLFAILKMPFLFLLLHVSYGTGFLAGIFKNIKK